MAWARLSTRNLWLYFSHLSRKQCRMKILKGMHTTDGMKLKKTLKIFLTFAELHSLDNARKKKGKKKAVCL